MNNTVNRELEDSSQDGGREEEIKMKQNTADADGFIE